MSSEVYPAPQEKHQDTCWLCGRMLRTGYHFACHTCGATYCYSHAPEKCQHTPRRRMPAIRSVTPKA